MRHFLRVAAWLSAIVIASLGLADVRGQPVQDPFARFVPVKSWQVHLELVYDNKEAGRTEHATSIWKGVLRRDESFWPGDRAPDELRWYGDMDVDVDGIVKTTSGRCRITITAHGPDRYGFALTIRKGRYVFDQGYCGTSFGEREVQCPGEPDTTDKGGITYSPMSWRVVRKLPAKGEELSGKATIDASSPDQVPDERLQSGETVKVRWTFTPTSDYVCGPDVTAAVTVALAEMAGYFARLVPEDKVAHCKALHGEPWIAIKPLIQAGRAWDMSLLFWGNASWLDSYTTLGTCDVPGDGITDANEDPSTCKHSVSHSGKCVLAGTLNYFTYGYMHRLCHDYAVETSNPRNKQLQCVIRLGGCSAPGGVPSGDALADYNRTCRAETSYSGDDIVPSPGECSYQPEILDAADWDKDSMAKYIATYKILSGTLGDLIIPTAFANAAFDDGPLAVPPFENRRQCSTPCGAPSVMPPFPWTWYPGHIAP